MNDRESLNRLAGEIRWRNCSEAVLNSVTEHPIDQYRKLEDQYTESEALRNQTLQSLFGIRRQIEQMQLGDGGELVLAEIHQCQKDLTQLSDRLFSPYGVDSIPLAIKDVWREISHDSKMGFQVSGSLNPAHIPDRWQSLAVGESSPFAMMNGQLLLVWLRKILKAALRVDGIEQVEIDLLLKQSRWQRVPFLELNIQFRCRDSLAYQQLVGQSDLRLVSQRLTHLAAVN